MIISAPEAVFFIPKSLNTGREWKKGSGLETPPPSKQKNPTPGLYCKKMMSKPFQPQIEFTPPLVKIFWTTLERENIVFFPPSFRFPPPLFLIRPEWLPGGQILLGSSEAPQSFPRLLLPIRVVELHLNSHYYRYLANPIMSQEVLLSSPFGRWLHMKGRSLTLILVWWLAILLLLFFLGNLRWFAPFFFYLHLTGTIGHVDHGKASGQCNWLSNEL